VTATSATPGRILDGRYELRTLIGQGTFGRVYSGYDQRLDRAVAVKVIKPWWTEDQEWAERFEREAQLMARVSHPGIVQIYDIGFEREGLYYVAELVDGESLATRLRRGPLPPAQVRDIAEQLCRALAAAHAQRVVHRDVKPANVLIDRTGRVKVGDFGIARLADGSSEGVAGTILGTPRYMAPEQARGRVPTPASDVYGAGVVAYEMLAGQPPFVETSPVELALRHLNDPPPPLPSATPPALATIVERALAKDPAERYPTGREMADALLAADLRAGDGPRRAGAAAATKAPRRSPDPTRVAPKQTPRRVFNPPEGRRYRALLAGVVLILLAMIGTVVATSTGTVRVPNLVGLRQAGVLSTARERGLRVAFTRRYSRTAASGTAIAQAPASGAKVNDGSTLHVTLSAGPPPVPVPQLLGQSSTAAATILQGLGLDANVNQVPAPGVTPGLVVGQSPSATVRVARRSTVNLSVAEVPRWRPLTSFSGDGAGQSVPFRIRGKRFRLLYNMGYDGTCTFIFFCSGPSAQVSNVNSGATLNQFSLNQGSGQTQVFNSGPGVYQVSVTPGNDSAHWSIQLEDDY
jgi:eukaryotic-like serine/threonine-protein kinase